MQNSFKCVSSDRKNDIDFSLVKRFGIENAGTVNRFHQSFPEYSVTPLISLNSFAKKYGVRNIYVKDESFRLNLNAFKVLGSTYAAGRYIAGKLGVDFSCLTYEKIISADIKTKLGPVTFATATDGNHGRGVAWTANRLGQKSVVYMPKGTAAERLENIRKLGSDASITDLCYDDAVRKAKTDAESNGWVLMQDTSWEGYEEIPGWIMEGYTTMAYEAVQQLNGEKPTHIFLQAGVGSMAGALAGFFADLYGNDRPVVTVVEPDKADCIYRTAEADDGRLHFVTDDMNSIMAGLSCGEPCSLAWNILKSCADNFVSIPDWAAAKGMRILGNPLSGDKRIVSGESGASTFGLVAEVLMNPSLVWLKNRLMLDEDSKILCISTEGATDRENYRRIVWDGLYQNTDIM